LKTFITYIYVNAKKKEYYTIFHIYMVKKACVKDILFKKIKKISNYKVEPEEYFPGFFLKSMPF
jgi:hypothetical protein